MVNTRRLALLLGAPVLITLGCWIYLGEMIGDMSVVSGIAQLPGLFIMWAVMMAAMMVPTALPMLIAYARMRSAEQGRRKVWLSILSFVGGYVAAWSMFSAGAATLQTGLTNLALFSALFSPEMMKLEPGYASGGVLMVAGIYQFLPFKHACLHQCRTPIGFLMTQWIEGQWGAFVMGWRHGLFCVGCCWALMGLLFVVGVMNIFWIVAITVYVLLEKVLPHSKVLTGGAGIGLMGAGAWIIWA